MGPELPAGPQPLQVLHVSEQEEDILAFRMGLKQPVTKTTTVHVSDIDSQTNTNLPLSFLTNMT